MPKKRKDQPKRSKKKSLGCKKMKKRAKKARNNKNEDSDEEMLADNGRISLEFQLQYLQRERFINGFIKFLLI